MAHGTGECVLMELEKLIESLDKPFIEKRSVRAFNFLMKICKDCGFGFPVYSNRRDLVKRCPQCKKFNRKEYLKKLYRSTHQKPYWKEDKILDALCEGKKTIEQLAGIAKTNQNSVRVTLTNLRKKNNRIVKIGSYYRRLAL
jgi:hypothetical protein